MSGVLTALTYLVTDLEEQRRHNEFDEVYLRQRQGRFATIHEGGYWKAKGCLLVPLAEEFFSDSLSPAAAATQKFALMQSDEIQSTRLTKQAEPMHLCKLLNKLFDRLSSVVDCPPLYCFCVSLSVIGCDSVKLESVANPQHVT